MLDCRSCSSTITAAIRDSEGTGQVDRQALRRSGWLKHLSAILEGAVLIAKNVHVANSHVLVHCSDGWDRTAQLSAIAQLCLDPFYRTTKGFAILIEKDWLSFGHKFAHRAGHLVPDRTSFVALHGDSMSTQATILASVQKNLVFASAAFKETSPVFHQFLDCVYQIMRQYPKRFEFGASLLEALYYQLYSCQFGTFLYNSEYERRGGSSKASETTRSVWELFFKPDGSPKSEFLNAQYESALDDPKDRNVEADQGVLLPNPSKVVFWHELFHKTEEQMNGGDTDEIPPEVIEVEGAADDPVVSIIEDANAGLVQNVAQAVPRNLVPPPLRSSSPGYGSSSSSPSTANAPVQIQNAVQSVWRFGGSSWKALQRGYQEATKDFQTPASPTNAEIPPVRNGRNTDGAELGTWKAPRQHTSSSRPTSQPNSRAGSVPSSPGKTRAELPIPDSLPTKAQYSQPAAPPQVPSINSNPWASSRMDEEADLPAVQSISLKSREEDKSKAKEDTAIDPLGVGL